MLRSEYFKTALSTAVGDQSKTMEVNEFSFEVLSTAVDFMYGIEIPEDFNKRDDLKSLLHMADQYLMEDLKVAVSFRIGKDLNKKNIFETSYLAEKFGAMALSKKCADFIFENAGTIEDEKLDEMNQGVVLASLAKKFVKESKRDNWMDKLFNKSAVFRKREDFGPEEDYKGYVMARIQPRMFVSCNTFSTWKNGICKCDVKEGHVGFVLKTDSPASVVVVNWLTIPNTGDPKLAGMRGPYEWVDLLTSPLSKL